MAPKGPKGEWPKGNDQRGMRTCLRVSGLGKLIGELLNIDMGKAYQSNISWNRSRIPTSSWGNWSLCLAAEDDFLPVWGPNREFPAKVSNWISLLLLFRFYTFARVLSWWQPAHHMTIRDQRPLYIILASYGVHEYGVQIRVVRSDNSSSRHYSSIVQPPTQTLKTCHVTSWTNNLPVAGV